MSFASSLKSWAKNTEVDLETVTRMVTLQLATSIIERTPVGQPQVWKSKAPPDYVGGRLRANWQFAEDNPAVGILQTEDYNAQLKALSVAIAQSNVGGVTWLSNNMPYAMAIEFEGHSGQAPNGMARLAVAEAQAFLNQAMGDLK